MTNKLRIGLLCNNKMAIPAMKRMIQEGVLCSVATPNNDVEVQHIFSTLAAEHNIPWYCINKKDSVDRLIHWLEQTQPDVVFMMTFPWRIPISVFSIPRLGFLNFHYGLLPAMRGADPIFESIRQGRQTAGLSVHIVDEGLDTGPLVALESIPLAPGTTYGMLCSQMAWLGEKTCAQLIKDIQDGKDLLSIPQDEQHATYWPKLTPQELTIRWTDMDSTTIQNLVRSCNPITRGVPAMLNGWTIGICEVAEITLQGDATSIVPGTIVAIDQQNGLIVVCRDGKALRLEVIYAEEGFLPGYKLGYFGITTGMTFSTQIVDQQKETHAKIK